METSLPFHNLTYVKLLARSDSGQNASEACKSMKSLSDLDLFLAKRLKLETQ